jgi:hypothetical protein
LPALAIGHAERDEAAGPQARAYFSQKFIGLGLVLQHLEECHHIKDFVGMLRPEILQRQSEDTDAGTVTRRETCRGGSEFHAGGVVAGVPRGAHKTAGAAADVQEAAAARSEHVREKKAVARLKRKNARGTLALYRGIPARVGHFARIPELQAATGTFVQGYSHKTFPECGAQQSPCIRDKELRATRTEKLREQWLQEQGYELRRLAMQDCFDKPRQD